MKEEARLLMATIQCFTYNQEAYIRECLEGFVMQETNFKFEAIVHDDASTDNTATIIREYAEKFPDIIKPIYETENQYSKGDGSLARIMNEHTKGKYVAFCEGDDYWTDPLKLQKQVDFLESHPDYGMVYTNHTQYVQKTGEIKDGWSCQSDFTHMLKANSVCTLTVCIRRSLLDQYYIEIQETAVSRKWLMGDYPMWLYAMSKMKAKYLSDITGTYRVLENSASHFESREKEIAFFISTNDIRLYFALTNNAPPNVLHEIATRELENLIYYADSHNISIDFPLFNHMLKYGIFTPKRYISIKLRLSNIGRKVYKLIKVYLPL